MLLFLIFKTGPTKRPHNQIYLVVLSGRFFGAVSIMRYFTIPAISMFHIVTPNKMHCKERRLLFLKNIRGDSAVLFIQRQIILVIIHAVKSAGGILLKLLY